MKTMSLRPGVLASLFGTLAGPVPLRKLLLGLAAALLFAGGPVPSALAADAGAPLDPFPSKKLTDKAALQDGARTFVNYCQTCHGAALMRYNRLHDIGLTDEQIRNGLIFDPNSKVGDTMKTAIRPEDAKTWFGALPPDLSVITRARVDHFAIGLDSSNDTSEPPKPSIAANTSRPLPVRGSMPNTAITTLRSSNTARLVARNRATRLIMLSTPQSIRCCLPVQMCTQRHGCKPST